MSITHTSSPLLFYPPPAHTHFDSEHITTTQPRPMPAMTTSNSKDTPSGTERAERIRGGCIPCPVRSFHYDAQSRSLIPHRHRVEDAALSSRYLVVRRTISMYLCFLRLHMALSTALTDVIHTTPIPRGTVTSSPHVALAQWSRGKILALGCTECKGSRVPIPVEPCFCCSNFLLTQRGTS